MVVRRRLVAEPGERSDEGLDRHTVTALTQLSSGLHDAEAVI